MTSRLTLHLVLLAPLLGATAGACRQSGADARSELPPATGPGAAARPELPSIAPATEEGQAGEVATARKTTGTTHPRERAEIAPNMSGVLAKIAVDEGDRVEKGQLLFRLRASDMSLRVEQAKRALASARVQHSATKVEYDRMKRLHEQTAVDQATFDKVNAQYQAAEAAVEQAKVGLSLAHKTLADAAVRSPIAGVVTKKLKNEGEAASMMPPTVVLVVENHSVLELRFRLPERALKELEVGDEVIARFEALGAERRAKVSRISPNVDPRTRTVEVIALLDNAEGALRAGMLAAVELADDGDTE